MDDITEKIDLRSCPELHCIKCKGVLSVSPILLDNNGDSICGRCKQDFQEGSINYRNTFYEILARQFYFPCTFYKEGCFFKAAFNKFSLHEETCPFKLMNCPVKTCLWCGNTAELIIHFDELHPDLKIMNNDIKKLPCSSEGGLMFSVNNFYFLIKWLHLKSSIKIKIDNLNDFNMQDNIKFSCSLIIPELVYNHTETITYLLLKDCIIFDLCDTTTYKDISALSILLSVDVKLPSDFVLQRLEQLNKLKCQNCDCYMTIPILKCPANHQICLNCIGADYDFCAKCIENELHFSRVKELEIMLISLIYTCKWDCEARFIYKEIQAHEQSCSKRVFMCLHCYEWHGTISELISHDMLCPSKRYVWPLITDNKIVAFGKDVGMFNYTLITHKEIFLITIQFMSKENTVNVSISNYGPVSCFDWYRYEVDLQHIENKNFPFNKTFIITNKRNNEYSMNLMGEDVNNLGGLQSCKVVLRVVLLNDSDRQMSIARTLHGFN